MSLLFLHSLISFNSFIYLISSTVAISAAAANKKFLYD